MIILKEPYWNFFYVPAFIYYECVQLANHSFIAFVLGHLKNATSCSCVFKQRILALLKKKITLKTVFPGNQVFTERCFVQTLSCGSVCLNKELLDLNTAVHLKMKNQIKRNQLLKVNAVQQLKQRKKIVLYVSLK